MDFRTIVEEQLDSIDEAGAGGPPLPPPTPPPPPPPPPTPPASSDNSTKILNWINKNPALKSEWEKKFQDSATNWKSPYPSDTVLTTLVGQTLGMVRTTPTPKVYGLKGGDIVKFYFPIIDIILTLQGIANIKDKPTTDLDKLSTDAINAAIKKIIAMKSVFPIEYPPDNPKAAALRQAQHEKDIAESKQIGDVAIEKLHDYAIWPALLKALSWRKKSILMSWLPLVGIPNIEAKLLGKYNMPIRKPFFDHAKVAGGQSTVYDKILRELLDETTTAKLVSFGITANEILKKEIERLGKPQPQDKAKAFEAFVNNKLTDPNKQDKEGRGAGTFNWNHPDMKAESVPPSTPPPPPPPAAESFLNLASPICQQLLAESTQSSNFNAIRIKYGSIFEELLQEKDLSSNPRNVRRREKRAANKAAELTAAAGPKPEPPADSKPEPVADSKPEPVAEPEAGPEAETSATDETTPEEYTGSYTIGELKALGEKNAKAAEYYKAFADFLSHLRENQAWEKFLRAGAAAGRVVQALGAGGRS